MTDSTSLRVARILHPITTLGPGRRVGLWVQGCTLGCPGCASLDTWDPDGAVAVPIEDIARVVGAILRSDPSLTGLTITGGEPLQQSPALASMLRALRAEWESARTMIDVLLFTGYGARAARAHDKQVLDLVDVAVTGPYRAHAGPGGDLLGSANQSVRALTKLGRERLATSPPDATRIQVTMDGEDLTLVGLPRPGDLDRLRDRLDSVGITMAEVSWRP